MYLPYEKVESYQNYELNIYDEPLESCGSPMMTYGSWDADLKCNEDDGGVHQICVQNITETLPNFSKSTGQTDWSAHRENNNHCVCLGAWSLYNTNNFVEPNALKCEAIPKKALSNKYVSNFMNGWSKWNGLEISYQVTNGVESMVRICNKNDLKSKKLINTYCDFAKEKKELNKSPYFIQNC